MGKSPPTVGGNHGHKQRRAGDYLLFKQIAGPVWPRLQRPLNFAPLQMLKSPSEGIGVLLRNKQLLGQNSLWSRVDRQQRCTTLVLIGRQTGRSSSRELMLGWLRRLLGSRAINSNKLMEDYLMCSSSR